MVRREPNLLAQQLGLLEACWALGHRVGDQHPINIQEQQWLVLIHGLLLIGVRDA